MVINKKVIIIVVLWNLLILIALGWSLDRMITEGITTGKYMDLADAAQRVRVLLKAKVVSSNNENNFLKMQLKEFGHYVPDESKRGFWTVRLASYAGKDGEKVLNETLKNVFIKNKMFDVVFYTEYDSWAEITVLCYGKYKTQAEASQQLDKMRNLHNDFKGCAVEESRDDSWLFMW